MNGPRALTFGPFRLDTLNQQLWRDSELLDVRPKTLKVLLYLASNPRRLITRRELMENVWPDTQVSTNLLRAYVWELRHLLDDSADSPRYLETVNRLGYRFLQPVVVDDGKDPVVGDDMVSHPSGHDSAARYSEAANLTDVESHAPAASRATADRAPRRTVNPAEPPIIVGVLHSLTGTMAHSEGPVVDAILMAIEEVNHRGGLLGRRVQAEVVDGHSSGDEFARQAERLLAHRRVGTIFGCWMLAHRKRVVPVVESHGGLLVYPVQYEGLETSPCVFYTGAAPNQQIIPAVRWSFGFLNCKRLFLVGSDYIFPRVVNEIIRDQVARFGGQIAGEVFIPSGAVDMGNLAATIAAVAFAIGALLAGIAGVLFTLDIGVISPAMMGVMPSIEMVVWVAVGGCESLIGAVIGTLLVNFGKDMVSSAFPQMWLYVIGALFLLTVTVLPDGLGGLFVTLTRPRRAEPREAMVTPRIIAMTEDEDISDG